MVAQTVKKQPVMWETWVQSLGREEPLEKGMATHSSIQCSCLENPHGQRSLVGYSPWDCKESDMIELTEQACMHVPEPQEVNGRVINVTE